MREVSDFISSKQWQMMCSAIPFLFASKIARTRYGRNIQGISYDHPELSWPTLTIASKW